MTSHTSHLSQANNAFGARQRWSRAFGNLMPWPVLLFMLLLGALLWQGTWDIQTERLRSPETLERDDRPNFAGPGLDYLSYYAAGSLVREGRGDEIYDIGVIHALEEEHLGFAIERRDILPYFNPPFVAGAFSPLTLLPVGHFAIVVFVLVVIAEVAGGAALQRLLGLKTRRELLFFWAWYASLFSLFWMAIEGQISMFLFFSWLGFFGFQTQGKEKLSGAALALGLLKPQYVLLPVALLVVRKQWRALATFGAIAAALVMASILVSGLEALVDYPRYLLESTAWQDQGIESRRMFGLNSLVTSITGDHSPSLLIMGPLYLITLGAVVAAWRGAWEPTSPRFMLQIGVTIVASLLISAHLYSHDLCLLTLVIGLGARHSMLTTAHYGAWPWIAVAVWAGQLYGLELQLLLGVNVVTPAMVALGLYMLMKVRSQKTGKIEGEPSPAMITGQAA